GGQAARATMTISVRNLDAALGAEIGGIDLSKPVAQDDVQAIEDAWGDRLVVVFRGQKLSDPQLIPFRRNFGELDPPGPNPYGEPFNKEHPELNVISNVVENASRSAISATAKPLARRHDICRCAPQSRDAAFPGNSADRRQYLFREHVRGL